jgi:hypothetical protein
MTTYYATATEVKDQLRKVTYSELGFATDAAFITAIESLLGDVDIIIDNYTHRQFFEKTAQTEIFDGQEQQYFFPTQTPIVSLTKVEYRSNQSASWGEVTLTDFYAYDEYVYYESRFAYGHKNYRITYTYGYASVPAAVKRAAILIAGNAVTQWRLNALGVTMAWQDYKVKVPTQDLITPNEEAILRPYVKPAVGIA